jgi:hypothetical protein
MKSHNIYSRTLAQQAEWLPARRRRWWSTGLVLLFVALSALGCGGGTSGGGVGGQNVGTTPGAYVITITDVFGVITQMGTVSLTVQ